nr:aorsin [Quercus suber]
MHFSLFLSAALAGLAASAPSANTHVLHEKRESHPIAWTKHSRAEGHLLLPVKIGLTQRNLEHGDRFLDDISDPESANFEKVANVFAPAKETSDRTLEWLESVGIHPSRISHSTGRNWIEFTATVAEAESLFNTEYHRFAHKETGAHRLACDEYSLPQHVRQHIDFVMPTIQLDGLQPVAQKAPAYLAPINQTGLTGTTNCTKLITIDCLRAIYNLPVAKYHHSGNELGIAEWADYLYLPDLKTFFQNFTSPRIPSDVTPEFISIDGGKPSNLSVAEAGEVVESALDFQTAYSIIYPQGIRLYQNGDSVNVDSVGTFNIFLDALDASYCTYQGGDQPYVDPAYPDPNEGGYTGPLQCGGAPKSNVISVSYGQIEGALGVFYQQRQCREWMKLALQGVSVIYSSGDSGVANRYNSGYNNSCLNSEYGYVEEDGKRFSPSFPPSCPYITTVGATTLISNDIHGGEKAVAAPNGPLSYYSGGGFSDVFPRPSWQAKAVQHYLDKYSPNYGPSIFNRSGRAFPDVSALGLKLATVYGGKTYGIGGTSASAPIFASVITLLNEERLRIGKKPIGFLNPIIYKHPEMFNDIVLGSNPGCGTQGFPASPGWDPVTGTGTPDYEKMKKQRFVIMGMQCRKWCDGRANPRDAARDSRWQANNRSHAIAAIHRTARCRSVKYLYRLGSVKIKICRREFERVGTLLVRDETDASAGHMSQNTQVFLGPTAVERVQG